MAVRLFSRSQRVTPESALVIEQRKIHVIMTTRKAARAIASASSRREARETAGTVDDEEIPFHLLRLAHPTLPPLVRTIMGLVLVPVDGTPSLNTSCSSPSLKLVSTKKTADAAPATFRVGSPGDDEETADLRRRRIYALNQLLSRQHQAQWQAYRRRRSRQMAALSRCADSGSVTVSRWGLRRFAECCARLREDERRQAEEAQRWLEEEQRREAEKLARCAARARKRQDDDAALQANEEMLLAMPCDPECAGGKTKYCPWFSTVDGCPLGACPLSHAQLPIRLVTYKYRLWAMEVSECGWVGEPMNGPSKA